MSAEPSFTTEQHWDQLAAFARWEGAYGGPDPHMTLSAEMASRAHHSLGTVADLIWRGGTYIAFYNAPYGELLAQEFPWRRMEGMRLGGELRQWLDANWQRLEVHRHRKTVRRADWMEAYLLSYRDHVPELAAALGSARLHEFPQQHYDRVWNVANDVHRLGRYVALKLLEYFRLVRIMDAPLHDLRPRDGWSPRKALAYLWPEHGEVARKDNSPELLLLANDLGNRTIARLSRDYGLQLDHFRMQVFLCEYKQAAKGRQHPGRAADTEMKLAYRLAREWGERPTDIWRARRAVLRPEVLGEIGGWDGNRDELKTVLPRYGYTWSDLMYDYPATLASREFGTPVTRPEAAANRAQFERREETV